VTVPVTTITPSRAHPGVVLPANCDTQVGQHTAAIPARSDLANGLVQNPSNRYRYSPDGPTAHSRDYIAAVAYALP